MEKQCAGCGKIFEDDKPRPTEAHGTRPVSGTIMGQCPECEKAIFRSKVPEAPKPAAAPALTAEQVAAQKAAQEKAAADKAAAEKAAADKAAAEAAAKQAAANKK